MFTDKPLRIALLISFILHTLMLVQMPHLEILSKEKPLPKLEVTYLKIKEIKPKKTNIKTKPPKVSKTLAAPKDRPAQVKLENNKDSFVKLKKEPKKQIPQKAAPLRQVEQIEIPPELPKEDQALYVNYYQSIRGRIREFVVDNYPRFVAYGEVCLRFVLLSNGKLKELTVVVERSSPNNLLQKIAKKSVRQASPFSAFPKGLNQAELSFNVIISFELEE